MEKIIFELPDHVILPRVRKSDKKIMLNMNVYRNLHHQTNNQIKQLFRPISGKRFKAFKIRISYKVYKPTKRLYDVKNITTVVDKFFCDWLVKYGFIPDDNILHVCYGGEEGFNEATAPKVIAEVEVLIPAQGS